MSQYNRQLLHCARLLRTRGS